jgi:cholera toxin transcriptional activator
MEGDDSVRRYRFGVFEADAATGELRRQGIRVKLNSQPFQMLLVLLERPGELVTREDICLRLWPDGTFVDYEHGVNSAVNRIREALGDTAGSPRFVETLARRGYRFVAPVEKLNDNAASASTASNAAPAGVVSDGHPAPEMASQEYRILAGPDDLPKDAHSTAVPLFLLLQLMYLAFYVGALANLAEIEDLVSALRGATEIYLIIFVTAAVLIPVRAFTLCVVLFRAPGVTSKLLRLWPFLFFVDELWALSPFLLLHHINAGLALACTALLVYSPFAQRSLVLMGAGAEKSRVVSSRRSID